jgi:hypothetical protein
MQKIHAMNGYQQKCKVEKNLIEDWLNQCVSKKQNYRAMFQGYYIYYNAQNHTLRIWDETWNIVTCVKGIMQLTNCCH